MNFGSKISNVIKGLIKYHDLGYVLDNIESVILLPIPYKNPQMTTEQYEENKELSLEINENAENEYNNFLQEYELRKATFQYIRSIYPSFCENMKKKISTEEYEEYLYLLKKCSKDISELILSFSARNNDHKELFLEKKDIISSIVDTEENSRLTFLQDRFVLEELESIDCSNMDLEIQKNIEKIKKQLRIRIENYQFFQKLYSKGNQVNIVKSSKNVSEDIEI